MTLVWLLSLVAAAGVGGRETAVVGIRVAGEYKTIAFFPTGSGGFAAVSVHGLLPQTDVGLVAVDVVPDCRRVSSAPTFDWHYLVVTPTPEGLQRRCMTSNYGEGGSEVRVLFVGRRYLSVEKIGEAAAFKRENAPHLTTTRWGQGTAIPMQRILPESLIATMDRYVDAYRTQGIAAARSAGALGDADPCWYGSASRESWGIVRAERRWVVRTMLESRCSTYPHTTTVHLPDEVVDGVANEEASVTLSTDGVVDDVLLSPDGRLAVVVASSSVTLRPVDGNVAGDALARVLLSGWRPGEQGRDDAVVMTEWLDPATASRWRDGIERLRPSDP